MGPGWQGQENALGCSAGLQCVHSNHNSKNYETILKTGSHSGKEMLPDQQVQMVARFPGSEELGQTQASGRPWQGCPQGLRALAAFRKAQEGQRIPTGVKLHGAECEVAGGRAWHAGALGTPRQGRSSGKAEAALTQPNAEEQARPAWAPWEC